MLLVVKVRLTSPFLGELRPDPKGVRRFKKTGGNIVVDAVSWQEQFQLAAHQLKLGIDVKTIEPPSKLLAASIHLYSRYYNKVQMEWFESFRKGTILTMDFLIRDDKKRSPNLDQFRVLLEVVGRHFGLSQWGNKFGFGRFELLEITTTVYRPPMEIDTTVYPTTVNNHETTSDTNPGPGANRPELQGT